MIKARIKVDLGLYIIVQLVMLVMRYYVYNAISDTGIVLHKKRECQSVLPLRES